VLYAGLAMTARGIRVIEFNARFGDPETQVVLTRLVTPLGQFLYAAATGQLKDFATLVWRPGYAVNVVIAAQGYPENPVLGTSISGVEFAEADPQVAVFHAGTELVGSELVTSGGRVLSVCAQAPTLIQARERAYAGVAQIEIAGSHFRSDIARNACATDS
jgi:phosphoribosylamine--glycine ligase